VDDTSDITRSVTGDITWMTYADLGRARGITAASAKRLAIRRHWRRHQGNDGTARVAVPVTEATRRETDAGDIPGEDASDDTGDVTPSESAFAAIRAAHAGETAALRERADAAERARGEAQALADQAIAQVADLSSRIEKAIAIADRATSLAADANARAERAEAAIAGERKRADEARATTERAQEDLADERRRAVSLERDVAAHLSMAAEVVGELDAARQRAREAEKAAKQLRQAETERRGQGRWARLRAAWRGE